ncbi:MAG: 30S ribosomal protein S9 [Candidatus Micrarchaeota archaeon]
MVFTRGKKKESIARAVTYEGNGIVRINKRSINALKPHYLCDIVREPLTLASELSNKVNIDVDVYGGGVMGQAEAVRIAIARGLCAFSKSEELKATMEKYDRYMICEDYRRVEPKKYKGPKARARYQKSYR